MNSSGEVEGGALGMGMSVRTFAPDQHRTVTRNRLCCPYIIPSLMHSHTRTDTVYVMAFLTPTVAR